MNFRKKLVSFSKKEIDDGEYWLIANKLALRDEEGRIIRIKHIFPWLHKKRLKL